MDFCDTLKQMKCNKCGMTNDLLCYSKYKNKKYYRCRNCWADKQRTYRQTTTGKAATNKYMKKYRGDNVAKIRIWRIASKQAVKPCEVCKSTNKVHRHHPDYSEPEVVQFLCPLHHRDRKSTRLNSSHHSS